MKLKLLIFCLFASLVASAQPTNYTRIGARYRWMAGMFDSSLHIPVYNGTPSGLRSGSAPNDGALAMDTANNRLYIYSGGAWLRMAGYSEIGGYWTATGNDIYKNNSGNVGVGTTTPAFLLDVNGKYGIGGKQFGYLPNQTTYPNSMAFGTGLQQMTSSGSSYPGWGNTTLGYGAGDSITNGYNNTILGALAGARLKGGFYNTYIGIAAGQNGQNATENTYVGMAAAQVNRGFYNVVVGTGALALGDSVETSNIIGAQAARVARYMNQTVAIGYRVLNSFDSGFFNDALGYRNLESLVRGDANVSHGNHGLSLMTSGSYNTGIGFYAGNSILTGRHNSFFGAYSGNNALQKTDAVSSTAIGAYSYNTRNYETSIGSDSTKYLRLKATDSLQADLVRTTSYGWVWAFDSASKNTRYMPTSSISGGGGSVSSASGAGVSLVNGSSQIKRLKAGSQMTITDNTDSVTIASEWTRVSISSDQTTSATTGTNITGLSFSASANTKYEIRAVLVMETNASTTGYGVGFTFPASCTGSCRIIQPNDNTSVGTIYNGLFSGVPNPTASNVAASSSYADATIHSMLNVAGTSGTVQFQFHSENGAGGTATVKAGSYLEYRVIQ